MTTKIDSIGIPVEFVQLCRKWYDGQGDMMYAVMSTGGLATGSVRPYSNDAKRSLSDEEWYVSLWHSLAHDVRQAVKSASNTDHYDAVELRRFERFCELTAAKLMDEYHMEDSDAL
jgi:hypothetical protein